MGGLMGAPKTPQPVAPPIAPVPDQTAINASQQQQAALLAQRTGRASTILSPTYSGGAGPAQTTGTADKLGGN